MGNSLTVENRTSNTVELIYYLAGFKENSNKAIIESQSKKKYHIYSFKGSKTLIVSIDNKAFRAVRLNQSICIDQLENGPIKIGVVSDQFHLESDIEQIKENIEKNLNWNLIAEDNVNNESRKVANEMIKMMNNVTHYLGNVVSNVVRSMPTDKNVSNLFGKIVSDFIVNSMKTSEINLISTKDLSSLEDIKRIQYKLIGISRALEFDYSYLRKEIKIDNTTGFQFLHKQLLKITNTDMLVYLENCGLEQSLPVYIYAVNLAFQIFHEIRQLNEMNVTALEQNYVLIFTDNLEYMWGNIINKISSDCCVKNKGCLIKTAELRYQNQHIYKVKSICKARTNQRISDIKNAFIENRKYQTEYLFNHPDQLVTKWREMSNLNI